ncbi:ArsR/SmtB family transcription factor [Meiothermus hypogaeus]|uniref:Arsenical resistance operon repressor n=1 Tax=Meiothermus hypogaeus TaxID=884155 RepID=A0ABX9MJN5_9DEIN|nr:metalloregulator ArsR/SmtB family transcription factor [Meiothermus hypogaeus]RIH76317.1 Arsenical resistance operon repressor [Meiothermus hypogaeus]
MSSLVLQPDARGPEKSVLEASALVFKALSDPARLKILAHLAQNQNPDGACCGPQPGLCACDLETVTGLSQPTVSHHMKCLVSVHLVKGEKRGKWMYYRIDPRGFALIKTFLPTIGG